MREIIKEWDGKKGRLAKDFCSELGIYNYSVRKINNEICLKIYDKGVYFTVKPGMYIIRPLMKDSEITVLTKEELKTRKVKA